MAARPGAVLLLLSFYAGIIVESSHPPCWPYETCPRIPLPFPGSGYPETYNYSGSFPDGFAWGVGTAAYQIEGGYNEDGRGASIWDTFTGANTVGMPGSICESAPCPINPGMVARGATGNVADDHYHRWKSDVALMKEMGVKHYRFSLSWPRLVPLGNATAPGGVNPAGVAFYNGLIDELLASGITPVVTLYHWDLPQALLVPPYDTPAKMGWYAASSANSCDNPQPRGEAEGAIVPMFTAYAELCFREFGDRVKQWITFNEPFTFTWMASDMGFAPQLPQFRDMPRWALIAGHNVLLAHAAAAQVFRSPAFSTGAYAGGILGISNNMEWREPASTRPADITAAARAMDFQLGWLTRPLLGEDNDYPPSMRAILGDLLPRFTARQKAALHGSLDFLGMNNYGAGWTSDTDSPTPWAAYAAVTEGASADGPAFVCAEATWLCSAGWGLRKLVNWIKDKYGNPPLYITEGGWSLAANNVSVGVRDAQRTAYFANYTSQLSRAISEDGCDVRGYFLWSLYDNLEWSSGFHIRYGIVYNDYAFGDDPNAPPGPALKPTAKGQKRTRKDSSYWWSRVWAANAVLPPSSP